MSLTCPKNVVTKIFSLCDKPEFYLVFGMLCVELISNSCYGVLFVVFDCLTYGYITCEECETQTVVYIL